MIARRVVPQFCFAITMTGLDFGSGREEELMGESLGLYICIRLVCHPHRAHLLYIQTSEPSTWANAACKKAEKIKEERKSTELTHRIYFGRVLLPPTQYRRHIYDYFARGRLPWQMHDLLQSPTSFPSWVMVDLNL